MGPIKKREERIGDELKMDLSSLLTELKKYKCKAAVKSKLTPKMIYKLEINDVLYHSWLQEEDAG